MNEIGKVLYKKLVNSSNESAKKTDYEVIVEMLNRAKIEYEEDKKSTDPARALIIERGYINFFTEIEFNEDGSLYNVSAYE